MLRSIAILALVFSFSAAAAVSAACESPDVKRILRPFYPDESICQPRIEVAFEVLQGTDFSLPTIIYLPGGPGMTSIGNGRPSAIPDQFTVINVDPRGVGCNEYVGEPYPEDIYRTRYLASDVLAIVNHLNLRNYLLYGHSYGTAWATVAASMAEDIGVAHPQAVVLEGTVGRALRTKEEYTAGYQVEWARARKQLPPKVGQLFEKSPLPLDLSADVWGGFVHLGLMAGETNGVHYSSHILKTLPGVLPADAEAVRKEVIRLSSFPFSEAQIHLYRSLACRELVEHAHNLYTLKGMELVTKEDHCDGIAIDEELAFHAQKYPLKVPLYYFQGEHDPATPMWQARVHYDSQKSARKAFVTVPRAGHMPIANSLDDCAAEVWKAMATGGGALTVALKTCKVAPTLE